MDMWTVWSGLEIAYSIIHLQRDRPHPPTALIVARRDREASGETIDIQSVMSEDPTGIGLKTDFGGRVL